MLHPGKARTAVLPGQEMGGGLLQFLRFSFCLVHTHEIGKVLKKESERSKNVSFPFSVDCVSGFLFPSV